MGDAGASQQRLAAVGVFLPDCGVASLENQIVVEFVAEFGFSLGMRCEAPCRVSDEVGFQIRHFLLPHTDSLADGEVSHQLVFPLVLQYIDCVALGNDALSVTEHVASCHVAFRVVERAVVAGVEHDHLRAAVALHDVIEVDVDAARLDGVEPVIDCEG